MGPPLLTAAFFLRHTGGQRDEVDRLWANADHMEISARNQLRGRVTSVRTGSIMAELAITIEPADITAVITRGSVERLELKEGDEITVIIKSTEVMVGKG